MPSRRATKEAWLKPLHNADEELVPEWCPEKILLMKTIPQYDEANRFGEVSSKGATKIAPGALVALVLDMSRTCPVLVPTVPFLGGK